MQATWSDQKIRKLKKLWLDEELTATECGRELGVSRNSILSKVHRLRLPRRDKDLRTPSNIRLTERTRRVPTMRRRRTVNGLSLRELAEAEAEPIDLPPDQSEFAVTFEQLGESHCRWPLGDPQDAAFKFCGAEKLAGVSYCARHYRISCGHGRIAQRSVAA